MVRMEELLPCTLREVPDGLFCNAVLKMGVDPTEGETLPLCTAAVLEGIVCKLSIVAVVVEDAEACLASIVSSEVSLVIRWIYFSLKQWSTKMVTAV